MAAKHQEIDFLKNSRKFERVYITHKHGCTCFQRKSPRWTGTQQHKFSNHKKCGPRGYEKLVKFHKTRLEWPFCIMMNLKQPKCDFVNCPPFLKKISEARNLEDHFWHLECEFRQKFWHTSLKDPREQGDWGIHVIYTDTFEDFIVFCRVGPHECNLTYFYNIQ